MSKHKQPEQRHHRAVERLITNRPGLAQLHVLLPQVWAERKHWPWLLPLGMWLFVRVYRHERRKRP